MPAGALTLLSLVGAVQGLVLAAALATARGDDRRIHRALAALLATGSAAVVVIALSHRPELGDPRRFELIEAGLALLLAPLSLLYARLVTDLPVSPRRLGWHFAPGLLWGAWAAATGGVEGLRGVWLPPVGALVAYQVLYTTVVASILWRRWQPHRPSGIHRFWSRAWIGLLVAVHAAQGVRFALPGVAPLRDLVPLTLSGGFLVLTFAGLRHSRLFGDRGGRRTASRAASDPRLRGISDRVREYLEGGQRYLDPTLSLDQVAAELGIPRGQVSQAVNLGASEGFLGMLNGYRVQEARRLLADPSKAHLTIEAIAHRAGFASRSAFYETFRRQVGTTPGEFRERAHAALS